MELIRNWLLGITCAAMVVALCEALSPDGGVKRVGKLAGGLVLIFAIVAPIAKADYSVLSGALAGARAEAEGYQYVMDGTNKDLVKTIIAQQSSAYIQDKAVSLGIEECTVDVTCSYGHGDFPAPVAVSVVGRFTAEQEAKLRRTIEADFAIAQTQQTFERKGEG